MAAFVELHIEQGPLLEKEGTQLGIVTAIAAPAALRIFFSGDGGHAGALLMPYRCDHFSCTFFYFLDPVIRQYARNWWIK